jgi:hypothetical protein
MKGTLTSMLTLIIMVIALAMIIGGPRAVRFLFAPFLSGIQQAAQRLFVALIVLVLVAAAISSKRAAPKQVSNSSSSAQIELRE